MVGRDPTAGRQHRRPRAAPVGSLAVTAAPSRRSERLGTELLTNLTLRELRGKYKRSALGWTWSVLNPIVTIAVYALVFSRFLRTEPPIGDPSGRNAYVLFLVAALLPWTFLANSMTAATSAYTQNDSLVTKVWFPRVMLPVSVTLGWLITFVIEMLVALVIFAMVDPKVLVFALALPVLIAIEGVIVVSVSVMVAIANVYARDTEHIVRLATNLWFWVTPVIWPPSLVPRDEIMFGVPIGVIVRCNPMWYVAEAFRDLLYDLRLPSATTWAALLATAIVTAGLAVVVHRRYEPRLAEEL